MSNPSRSVRASTLNRLLHMQTPCTPAMTNHNILKTNHLLVTVKVLKNSASPISRLPSLGYRTAPPRTKALSDQLFPSCTLQYYSQNLLIPVIHASKPYLDSRSFQNFFAATRHVIL